MKTKKKGSIIWTDALKDTIMSRLNVESLCNTLNIEIETDNGFQMRGPCPIHGGNDASAFSIDYNKDNEFLWRCRTACGISGDLINLVMRLLHLRFKEAVYWLMAFSGIEGAPEEFEPPSKIESSMKKDTKAFNKEIRTICGRINKKEKYISPQLNEGFVNKCKRRRNKYFSNRGFSEEILERFEVGFCPEYESPWFNTKYRARVTIPLRDVNGKLVGLSGRTIVDGKDVDDKYKILPGSNKHEIFYGLNFSLPYVEEKGSIILVEGFSDVWRCWQYGRKNAVAMMGKELTHAQKQLLLGLVHTVAIAVDNDEYGNKGGDKIEEQVKDFLTTYRVRPPKGMDIGDCNYQQFQNSLLNARKIV